jgi:hypothetical protein
MNKPQKTFKWPNHQIKVWSTSSKFCL